MSETQIGKLDSKETSDASPLSQRSLEFNVTRADVRTLNTGGQAGNYTRDALTEMVSKYGPERVENMLKTLEGLQPETLASNSFNKERLNINLFNLSDLIQENKGGDLLRLSDQLKSEGYQKRLPLGDLTPRFIDTLSSNPQERQAFIEYSKVYARAFLEENPEYKYGHLPSETLSAYKEFEKAHPGGS